MKIAANLREDEPAGRRPEVCCLSQEDRYLETLRALKLLDAFVMEHAELEFKDFFFRLRSLGEWPDLLANLDILQSRKNEKKGDCVCVSH